MADRICKIITELVKEGIIVLVTTHSPYMVQAFSVFSKEADIKSDFYLSHKNDNGTAEIENVYEDINKIFHQLSKPLNDIVWGEEICSLKLRSLEKTKDTFNIKRLGF
jgi:predicted ATPase